MPCPMNLTDQIELLNLKETLINLESTQSSIITKVLTETNLSLSFESIMIYRNLNELFLYVNTHKNIDPENFAGIKSKLLNQIDLVMGIS
ncbi:MAG: hypothetical protein K0S53_503 [Bacteroidetes bacterium]|jgi:hypothetical protein|nr:hypothetical protein [Bacteroidota bacterium]